MDAHEVDQLGRLEAASTLALKLQSPTRKSVLSILKTGRDQRQPVTLLASTPLNQS